MANGVPESLSEVAVRYMAVLETGRSKRDTFAGTLTENKSIYEQVRYVTI